MSARMNSTDRRDELRYKGIDFFRVRVSQRVDDEHPPGSGTLGYRAVYKTLKLIPFPAVNLSWPNLKVRMVVESVQFGGFNVKGNAIPSVFPDRLLLPEFIEIRRDGNLISFYGETNMNWKFDAYEEEFPTSGIVELLLEMEDSKEENVIPKGRRRLSPILTILDLVYGERLVGALITEEVVELFQDGHWNRRIASPSVGSESQLDMEKIEEPQIEQMRKSIEVYQDLGESDRKNIAIATDWFWKSEREPDQIDRFIQLWICLEALEMPNTNIKPISKRLAIITSEDYNFWKEPVGRLFGRRSELVHGISSEVEEHEIIILRGIAKILLAYRLGEIKDVELIQKVVSLVDIHYQ
jgi:hypothetical protein